MLKIAALTGFSRNTSKDFLHARCYWIPRGYFWPWSHLTLILTFDHKILISSSLKLNNHKTPSYSHLVLKIAALTGFSRNTSKDFLHARCYWIPRGYFWPWSHLTLTFDHKIRISSSLKLNNNKTPSYSHLVLKIAALTGFSRNTSKDFLHARCYWIPRGYFWPWSHLTLTFDHKILISSSLNVWTKVGRNSTRQSLDIVKIINVTFVIDPALNPCHHAQLLCNPCHLWEYCLRPDNSLKIRECMDKVDSGPLSHDLALAGTQPLWIPHYDKYEHTWNIFYWGRNTFPKGLWNQNAINGDVCLFVC